MVPSFLFSQWHIYIYIYIYEDKFFPFLSVAENQEGKM